VAPTHVRYAADIALTDGGRIAADYVNLGATILRGASVDGRIDIPWQDIEVLSFTR
jgi:tetrahydrodipicolinate N-succinyltransferase